jgi:hypothetical protein
LFDEPEASENQLARPKTESDSANPADVPDRLLPPGESQFDRISQTLREYWQNVEKSRMGVVNAAYVAGRNLSRSVATLNSYRHESIPAFFHWQYSSILIPLLVTAGLAVAIDHQYRLSDSIFIDTGVWALCWWFTTDFLENQRTLLDQRHLRRDGARADGLRRMLNRWEWGVVLVILFLTACLMAYNHGLKADFIAAPLKQQRDDVFNRLIVQPLTFLPVGMIGSAEIFITNNPGPIIGQHTISCLLYALRNADNVGFDESWMPTPQVSQRELFGGGRGETVDCRSIVSMAAPIVCADMFVRTTFTVAGQPNVPMTKDYRPLFYPPSWNPPMK